MPIYEYRCTECGETTEALQRVSEPPLSTCEECGGDLKRLVSAPSCQFKGTGWYVTDYAGKGKEERAPDSRPGDGEAANGSADGSGDSTATSVEKSAPSESSPS